jgi:hypothetical protein
LNCFKETPAPRRDDAPMPDPITDLRGLDPPEPLLRILEAIEGGPGPHVFLLAREPFPLYPLLSGGGWKRRLRVLDRGFELTVFRPPAAPQTAVP